MHPFISKGSIYYSAIIKLNPQRCSFRNTLVDFMHVLYITTGDNAHPMQLAHLEILWEKRTCLIRPHFEVCVHNRFYRIAIRGFLNRDRVFGTLSTYMYFAKFHKYMLNSGQRKISQINVKEHLKFEPRKTANCANNPAYIRY